VFWITNRNNSTSRRSYQWTQVKTTGTKITSRSHRLKFGGNNAVT
jgi:hypothetical protein